jgi:hypothetical protein
MRGGTSLGSLLAGTAANLIGVRYTLLICSILAIIAHAAIGRRWVRTDAVK